MTTQIAYGDPSNVSSFLRGVIQTDYKDKSEIRNTFYLVGRSKVKASVVNELRKQGLYQIVASSTSFYEPFLSKPLDDKKGSELNITKDQYIYFNLVYQPAVKYSTSSTGKIQDLKNNDQLSFVSTNFTKIQPVQFTLNTQGVVVSPGKFQPFRLSPLEIKDKTSNLDNLVYPKNTVPELNSYTPSVEKSTSIYFVPQGTDSIELYNRVDDFIESSGTSKEQSVPNLPLHQLCTGVWYKTYNNEEAAKNAGPASLWNVYNPYANALNTLTVNKLKSGGIQLGAFTEGGTKTPIYIEGDIDNFRPEVMNKSPIARALYQSATIRLLDSDRKTKLGMSILAAVNNVGDNMSLWGLSEMEIMFVPVKSSILFSKEVKSSFGCYTTQSTTNLNIFQAFTTTPSNKIVQFKDASINSNKNIEIKGCLSNNVSGSLNIADEDNIPKFNSCVMMKSYDCTRSEVGDPDGFWYPYCTGTTTCGENNCYGNCPADKNGTFVQCQVDYSYIKDQTTPYYSCNPKKTKPDETGVTRRTIIIILIVVFFLFLLMVLGAYLLFKRIKTSNKNAAKKIIIPNTPSVNSDSLLI